MPKKNSIRINSLKELQALMPDIVPEVNSNPSLALAAAANPLLALEHLGYKLSEQAIQEIGPYARFGPDGLKRLAELERQWSSQVGNQPLPVEKEAIRKFLSDTLKTIPDKKKSAKPGPVKTSDPKQIDTALDLIFSRKRFRPEEEKKTDDSLASLHPALTIIRAYQKILSQRPAFASDEQFQKLLSGKSRSLATSVEFRLKARKEQKEAQAN